MAFEESISTRRSHIRDGQVTFTKAYINVSKVEIPWEYVRLLHDSDTVQLRMVEGSVDHGYKITDKGTYNAKIYCTSFMSRNYIPMGVYRLAKTQEPESLTFEFVRPTATYRKRIR